MHFSLMQPLCQISKKLYRKSNNLSTALRHKNMPSNISAMLESTIVRNSIINIHLPLMIFIRMHSQESQFHNKCLYCSIKSIIYVQISPFFHAFSPLLKMQEARAKCHDEKSKKVIFTFVETCQTMYSINL